MIHTLRSETNAITYHILFICKHQDDTVEHKRITDYGLKEETETSEKQLIKNVLNCISF